MTVDEFKSLINRRYAVRCDNIFERNTTIELLLALGYEINIPSLEYLTPGNDDFVYPHPVMESRGHQICCVMFVEDDGKAIRFAEIADLISYLDSSLDDRSDEEFTEAFAELMG